jgi:hypothetical protein
MPAERKCGNCNSELYEDEPGYLCQDCAGNARIIRLLGSRASTKGAENDPGHERRILAHQERVQADLARLRERGESEESES